MSDFSRALDEYENHVAYNRYDEAMTARAAVEAMYEGMRADAERWAFVKTWCVVGIGLEDYHDAADILAAVDEAMAKPRPSHAIDAIRGQK